MFGKIGVSTAAAIGAGALALVTLASGVTYAATRTTPVTTITACVHKSGGGLYTRAKCASGDSKLTWNIKGIAGPKGNTGPRGNRGPAGLTYFVRVDESGAVHQHSSGVSVANPVTGDYIITFPVNVSKCAAVASQGESTRGGFVPGTFYFAEVRGDSGLNPRQVVVAPTNAAGNPVAAGFDLILAC